MRVIDRLYLPLCAVSLLLPAVLGGLLHGSWAGFVTGLVWGGLIRAFLIHHVTFAVNSVCHFAGTRRFATDDQATNVAWLAPFTLGE